MKAHLNAYLSSPMSEVVETKFDEEGCLIVTLGCGSSLKMVPQKAGEISIGIQALQQMSVQSNVRQR